MNGNSNHKDCWPADVGILAIELYFPRLFVEQNELEAYDISQSCEPWKPGKYTEGLGQDKMGFCSDREDVNSVCLTVTKQLMEKYQVIFLQNSDNSLVVSMV